jgi:hypothetical protein
MVLAKESVCGPIRATIMVLEKKAAVIQLEQLSWHY